jgi:DNA processing protein
MESLHYWIWLSLAVTPGSESFKKLITRFETPMGVYNADETDLAACIGSRSRDFKALCDKSLDAASKIYDFCKTKSVGILTYGDENFPKALREIDNPPALLYYRGVLPDFNNECFISVVGTRRLTDYGRKNAFTIAHDLARCGFKIVSGMAVGIDGVAMAGALCAGGETVAFLGCGIDICYPSVHLTLAKEIVKCGAVITEYAPGTRPIKFNFPRRNRLISGLSKITVVVEGREDSGSMITARHARAQGKRVYAFPGNVGNDGSQATNLLIKNGASLCTGVFDILRDYENVVKSGLNPFKVPEKRDVNMSEVLSRYKVSCVAPSDDIFRTPYVRKQMHKDEAAISSKADASPAVSSVNDSKSASIGEQSDSQPALPTFDAQLLRLYKKIPMDVECSIESLVDENTDMRAVMKMLLKLEMSRFVVLIPGDKVKRNLR